MNTDTKGEYWKLNKQDLVFSIRNLPDFLMIAMLNGGQAIWCTHLILGFTPGSQYSCKVHQTPRHHTVSHAWSLFICPWSIK